MCNVYHSFDLSTDLIFSTEFCFKLFLRIFFSTFRRNCPCMNNKNEQGLKVVVEKTTIETTKEED